MRDDVQLPKRARRGFTPEQKAHAVRLVRQDKNLCQVARDLDLNPSVLRPWARQAETDAGEGPLGALTTDESVELGRTRFLTPNQAMTNPTPQLSALFARYPAPIAKLGRACYSRLVARLGGYHQIVYLYENQEALVISFSPTEAGYEGVCSLSVRPGEVKVFFTRGAELGRVDSTRLLKGSGKTVRYLEVGAASDLERAEVEVLFVAALKLAKPRVGDRAEGSIVFKVDSQKQRAERAKKAKGPAPKKATTATHKKPARKPARKPAASPTRRRATR